MPHDVTFWPVHEPAAPVFEIRIVSWLKQKETHTEHHDFHGFAFAFSCFMCLSPQRKTPSQLTSQQALRRGPPIRSSNIAGCSALGCETPECISRASHWHPHHSLGRSTQRGPFSVCFENGVLGLKRLGLCIRWSCFQNLMTWLCFKCTQI